MVSDSALARLCMALYDYPWRDDANFHWNHLEQPAEDHGVMWGFVTVDGFDVATFRGSASVRDWIFNFMALAIPIEQGPLGPVHPGFKEGCSEAWAALKPLVRNPLVLTGHSLGGAHAGIVGALATLDGIQPARLVTFGEPKPGFKKLAALLGPVSKTIYRNAWDIVPDLPVRIPPVENYVHSAPLTTVFAQPHGRALEMGPFAAHHMMLYEEAVAAKEAKNG